MRFHAMEDAPVRTLLERTPWIGLLVVLAFVGLRLSGCSAEVAPTPALFSDAISLDEALNQSAATGRPVFVVATADWCPPCQVYKKGALADESVVALIRARAIPVYLDIDANPEAAKALGVSSVPTSFLIRDHEVRARFGGSRSADALKQWIQANAG